MLMKRDTDDVPLRVPSLEYHRSRETCTLIVSTRSYGFQGPSAKLMWKAVSTGECTYTLAVEKSCTL